MKHALSLKFPFKKIEKKFVLHGNNIYRKYVYFTQYLRVNFAFIRWYEIKFVTFTETQILKHKNIQSNIELQIYTVKYVHKGHPRELQIMYFIDNWSVFGGCLL